MTRNLPVTTMLATPAAIDLDAVNAQLAGGDATTVARWAADTFGGGLVMIATGVDSGKVEAFRDLMKSEIARLKTEPPTDAEIAEAKRHLLGRKISAAQSNEEIAEAMLKDFLAVGRPESAEEFAAGLERVTREDVLNALDALQKGAVVTVRGEGVN